MLRVEKLVKTYGNFIALKGVSFRVRRGEILGLIGENGAGKSTTIRILVGLTTPTSGVVEYDGIDFFSNLDELKRKIGYVPEVDALYEDMTAKEYLKFFASLYGVKFKKEIMDKLGIPNKVIGEMSKGMKRKVSVARSLIHNPDYLIYDEPFSGLDPMVSLTLADFLKSLKDKAILFSAHNLYYVEYLCDRVVIMKSGEVIYEGDVEEIRGLKTYVIKTEGGVVKTNDVSELVDVMRNERVLSIDVEVKRLEDLYFELMRK
ncbi:ABC transporter ATP-binding protein [Archaeoglobus sp.]